MFDFSPEKLALLGVIALVVLGPERLPRAARTLARVLTHLRRMSGSFQEEVRSALSEPTAAVHKAVGEFGFQDLRNSVRDAVAAPFEPPTSAPSGQAPLPDDPSLN